MWKAVHGTGQQVECDAQCTPRSHHLLQLEATGQQSTEADAAASHLGKAVGVSALLRGTSYHAGR